MKRFLRLICLIVVVATLVAVPAYAQEQSSRASSYFTAYGAYCTLTSPWSLTVTFNVVGTGIMDEIGANKIKVQRSTDQENWTTIKTFEKAHYPMMTDTDTSAHAGDLSCTISTGYYYRAYVEFYASSGSGFGERYYYTTVKSNF